MSNICIDVSQFQSKIDWKKVKASGVDYAMIRVGGRYGSSGKIYTDSRYKDNLNGALENNIKVGAYFFTQAVNEKEAIEEAEFCINICHNYNITLPIAIDTEYLDGGRHNNINRAQRTKVVKAFCERIKKEGYIPMFYCGSYYLKDNLISSELTSYEMWLAQWSERPQCSRDFSIWQYSSTGKINGISSNVDMNKMYKEYGTPIYDKYSDDIKVKAVNVLLGKYGNGEERKKKLGTSYLKTQELVNIIIERLGL